MLLSLFVKGQALMRNRLNAGNDYGEGDAAEIQEKLAAFFDGPILNWIFWGVTTFFVILTIAAGVKFAMAKSPEEKQAAKSKLISLGIGLAIVFSASVLVTTLKGMIAGIWA